MMKPLVPLFVVVICAGLAYDAYRCDGATRTPNRLVMIDGDVREADLLGVDSKWSLTIRDASGEHQVEGAEVLKWGTFRDVTEQPQLLLVNHGVILADDPVLPSYGIELDDIQVVVHNRLLGRLRLARGELRGIILKPPVSTGQYDRLTARIRASVDVFDRLWLDNDDTISGLVQQWSNDMVRLVVRDQTIEIPLSRVQAIGFATTGNDVAWRTPPNGKGSPQAIVGFRDGTRLIVQSLIADRRRLHIRTTAGSDIDVPLSNGASPIHGLQMTNGAFDYVSDMKPLVFRHIPYLDTSWPLGVDRTPSGHALRCRDALFWKGISMRSRSRVAFELAGRYERFHADLALDDEAERGGSVIYRVLMQSETNDWREAYRSDVVRGNDRPLSISFKVRGARYLALIVDYADRADELDIADWLDARVTKPANERADSSD